MRKSVLLFGLVLVLAAAAGVGASSVGYVDFEFLFNAHPEYDSRNAELQAYAEEITEEFQTAAAELETENEMESLAAEFERQLDQTADELRAALIASVREFIGQVADEQGVSVVLPDATILYGGVNLTPIVLETMYESYGISVPSSLREYLEN